MPIYEYHCDDCGTDFEKLVRRAGDGVDCVSCGKDHVTQQMSTFSARASRGSSLRAAGPAACPGGMCQTPGMCGSNN